MPYYAEARHIMGCNFVGPELSSCFGVKTDSKNSDVPIPFSEDVLRASKDDYLLVSIFPLSIKQMIFYLRDKGPRINTDWMESEEFTSVTNDEIVWRLIPKFEQDSRTFPADINTDHTAQELLYTMITYFFATREKLFWDKYITSSSVNSEGARILIGWFDQIDFRRHARRAA